MNFQPSTGVWHKVKYYFSQSYADKVDKYEDEKAEVLRKMEEFKNIRERQQRELNTRTAIKRAQAAGRAARRLRLRQQLGVGAGQRNLNETKNVEAAPKKRQEDDSGFNIGSFATGVGVGYLVGHNGHSSESRAAPSIEAGGGDFGGAGASGSWADSTSSLSSDNGSSSYDSGSSSDFGGSSSDSGSGSFD
jgi:hypothetical protein